MAVLCKSASVRMGLKVLQFASLCPHGRGPAFFWLLAPLHGFTETKTGAEGPLPVRLGEHRMRLGARAPPALLSLEEAKVPTPRTRDAGRSLDGRECPGGGRAKSGRAANWTGGRQAQGSTGTPRCVCPPVRQMATGREGGLGQQVVGEHQPHASLRG